MFKTLIAQITSFSPKRLGQHNLRLLTRFLIVMVLMIITYSITFHVLMEWEGQQHSWVTGFYWTLTVMSTLGFGDITFETDVGRLFSIVVLLSGTLFMLVLLPFTFIEFFYGPWMNEQATGRAPRRLPANAEGHVLLTSYDAVTSTLIPSLKQYNYRYALLVPDVDEALRLHDEGISVVVGALDDPQTWQCARVEKAALVASTSNDVTNTTVALTVRGQAQDLPVITTASDEASIDILNLAGSDHVLRLEEMIGTSFAHRTVGCDALCHVIGELDELLIAEATAHSTPLVGKTLKESRLRERMGITVVGIWERGHYEPARPDLVIHDHAVLLLAGTKEHLANYDEFFCIYNVSIAPVVILGGGRVGRATARGLAARDVDYRIVEMLPERIRDPKKYVLGNAADLAVLEQAGIRETSSVIITTHEDDMNVYLTVYCRQLRPNIQIQSRATHKRTVATLHRAGADSVLSYASMGASAVTSFLKRGKIFTVAEGLNAFEVRVPKALAGRTVAQSGIRERTGCSVVATQKDNKIHALPGPEEVLQQGTEIILIGTVEAEKRFLEIFGA